MGKLSDHKVQRVLKRFPWRRRKSRAITGHIAVTTQDGRQLWADADELAQFEDPGPALLCAAMQATPDSQDLVLRLVEHHASQRGIDLPQACPAVTTAGLRVLDALLQDAGLDPSETLGVHPIGDLIAVTWAIAAARLA
jgi:hypothetical protein